MKPHHLRALQFVATHPGGTYRNAFPCGLSFRFDAPEFKRSPFRVGTLYQLVDWGLIELSDGKVTVSARGRSLLDANEMPRHR